MPKDSLLMEVLGDVDELSSAVGVPMKAMAEEDREWAQRVQRVLHKVGAAVAEWLGKSERDAVMELLMREIPAMENAMDDMGDTLPKLTQFVLPSGAAGVGELHFARAVCRRAERALVEYAMDKEEEEKGERGGRGRVPWWWFGVGAASWAAEISMFWFGLGMLFWIFVERRGGKTPQMPWGRREEKAVAAAVEKKQQRKKACNERELLVVVRYLNRLSDFLFVLARKVQYESGEKEATVAGAETAI